MWWRHLLLLFPPLFYFAAPRSIVKTLPVQSLNLKLGISDLGMTIFRYISVGEVELFYYFIESERNPVKDPLVLWLTGGPGCSAFSGLVYEIGPLSFNLTAFNGSTPSFLLNPSSWTQIANIIFLDAPVGTGFSYATTFQGYYSSDTKSANDIYSFLRKWLLEHSKFNKNPLYIAGDSYSGILVPMVVLHISNGNEVGLVPHMSLQGYLLGNPLTDLHIDKNSRVQYAHRMALISDEYYEYAKSNCKGEYVSPETNNKLCDYYLQRIKECTGEVNELHILEPKCTSFAATEVDKCLEEMSMDIIVLPSQPEKSWCRDDSYVLSHVWANDATVQGAIHIQNGTIKEWKRCNRSLSYVNDITSAIEYHQLLSKKAYRALIYSGDHDMVVPYVGTMDWIRSLNMTTDEYWRPWFVDGQVAGFTETYKENVYSLTFATVKGGGHTAPEYKPKQCLAMVDRWFEYHRL